MRQKEISPKLQAWWLGPYVVTEKINQVTCKMARDKSMILHFDLLKPICSAEIPLWVEQCRMRIGRKRRQLVAVDCGRKTSEKNGHGTVQ